MVMLIEDDDFQYTDSEKVLDYIIDLIFAISATRSRMTAFVG